MPNALPPGTYAPNFTLNSTPDQTITLEEFQGRPVILAFYPADWSPVCGDQLALYNQVYSEFEKYDAVLLGISVDGTWCHQAFTEARNLHFPLLADFEPKGEVARSYGVYREAEGISERALFVINADGIIIWSYVSPIGVNPGADGILKALEQMDHHQTTGGLTIPVSDRDHTIGSANAPVTLVEYGDYECPYCGLAHPVVKKLLREMGDQIFFAFRNFPLTEVHPHAETAARAAEIAADYDQFWPVHHALLDNQKSLDNGSIVQYAREAGIDPIDFAVHLNNGEKAERVAEDFMSGIRSGVNGTPTFFINGARYDGLHNYLPMKAAIESAIND